MSFNVQEKPRELGIFIAKVTPDSGAHQAVFQRNDQVLAVMKYISKTENTVWLLKP